MGGLVLPCVQLPAGKETAMTKAYADVEIGVKLGHLSDPHPMSQKNDIEQKLWGLLDNPRGICYNTDITYRTEVEKYVRSLWFPKVLAALYFVPPIAVALLGAFAIYQQGWLVPLVLLIVVFLAMLVGKFKVVASRLWDKTYKKMMASRVKIECLRQKYIFNKYADEFNEALRQLRLLMPESLNVGNELCRMLYLASNRMNYDNWVAAESLDYLNQLIDQGRLCDLAEG